MPELSLLVLLPGLLFIGFNISLFFLAFSAYSRVKGIERAVWAIVTQLQAMRREEHDPVQAAQKRMAREAAAPTGMVSNSMFGR